MQSRVGYFVPADGVTRAGGEIGKYWENALHSLADLPQVIDVRNYGLMGAVEVRSSAESKGLLGAKLQVEAWKKGVMLRGVGDAMCMSPPLIIEPHHIDRIVEVLRDLIVTHID